MLFNFGKTGNRNKTVDGASPAPESRDDATLETTSVDAVETKENNATEDVRDAAPENVNPVGEEINVGDFEPTAPAEAAVVLESAETNAAPENGEETIDVEANENESQTDAPKTDETVAALNELLEVATALRQDFDVKFKFDKKKEEQVDRLYEECKAYRDDIFWSLKKDLILDVVREIDEIEKRAAFFEKEERTSELCEKLLKFVRDTAENLRFALEQHDVYAYRAPAGSRFDPSRQRTLETKPTTDETLDKTIETLRSGFEYEAPNGKKRNVRREIVYVYKYEPPKDDDKTSTDETTEAFEPAAVEEPGGEAFAEPVETTASSESETNDR
jgi:molecular chaperone GrpE (heat shock protein)